MRLHWVVLGLMGCGAGDPAAVRESLAPGGPIPPQATTQATVTSIVPGAAHVGDTLSFVGTGFVGATVVTFPNGLNATPTVADDAHLTVAIPAGAVNGTPLVDNGLGPAGNKPLLILEIAAPTIASITPTAGGPSTNVKIAGTNLGGVYQVRVDGIEAVLTNVSAAEVDATMPDGITSGAITVTSSAGSATAAMMFAAPSRPRIYTITPPAGKAGDTITVTGKRFTGVTSVTVGGGTATFAVVNDTTLTFVVPAGIFGSQVGIDAATSNAFRLQASAAPTITNITPTTLDGPYITVNGTNLAGLREARIGNVTLSTQAQSPTQLLLYPTSAARSGTLVLTNDVGSVSSAMTVTVALPPVLRRAVPPAAHAGDLITLEGTRLSAINLIQFSGNPAPTAVPTVVDDSHLTVVVPAGAATGGLNAQSPTSSAYLPDPLRIISTAAPTISMVSPTSFAPGTQITITGTGLAGLNLVTFGAFRASFQPESDTSAFVFVPNSATSGQITLTNDAGSVGFAGTLFAPPPAAILHVAPLAGKPGDQVTLSGAGLSPITTVSIGGRTADFQIVDDNTIHAWVPLGASGEQQIYANNQSVFVASLPPFTVTPRAPVLADFQPSVVVPGVDVQLQGQGFSGVTSVTLNGVETLFFPYGGDTSMAFRVPDGATSGRITLTNAAGQGSSSDDLIVAPAPTVTSLSPTVGKPGETVTLSGSGLLPVQAVGMPGTVPRPPASLSDTQLSFVLPPSPSSGPYLTTPFGGISVKQKITVQPIDPPIIEAISPLSNVDPGPLLFVSLLGQNLSNIADVTFNGASMLQTYPQDDLSVLVRVPDDATSGTVTASNSAGSSDSPLPVTVARRPAVANIVPVNGPPGTNVVITGSDLSNVARVSFGDVDSEVQVVSDAELHAVVPAGAQTRPIRVSARSAQGVGPVFTVNGTIAPVLGDVFPSSGGNGDYVSIRGLHLDGITSVTVNGMPAQVKSVFSDTLRIILPAGVSSGPITVTNDAGSATATTMLTASAPRAPQLAAVSPAAFMPGATVTVTGTQLLDAFPHIGDRFDSQIVDNSATSITVQLTRFDIGTQITATNQYGETSLPVYVGAAPTITGFTPASGMPGDQVLVSGTGFTGATVAFNGTPAIAAIAGDAQLTATVPVGATTGAITVTNPLGTATSATPFTINGMPNNGGCGCDVGAAPMAPAAPLLLMIGWMVIRSRSRSR